MNEQDNISSELDQHMQARGVDQNMRVEETLKETAFEVTQLVFMRGENGAETGPYIRKVFPGSREQRELGNAYIALFKAQRSGKRFSQLPTILNIVDAADELVVIMEYVSGDTLRHRIEAYPDKRMEIAAVVFPQLCMAVSELHEMVGQPIIHRDITPSNVICCGDGPVPVSVVLVDFGIAREHKPEAAGDTTRFGTAEYAPPEQFGYGQTDARTDVYALGMLLAFCLTGQDQNPQTLNKALADSHVPPELIKVIEKATAFDPDQRYSTAVELKEAYQLALSPSAQPSPSTNRSSKKGKTVLIVAGVIAAIVLVAIACFMFMPNQTQAPSLSSTVQAPSSSLKMGTVAKDFEPPVIEDTIASMNGYGKVALIIAATNPNEDISLQNAMLHITGKDAAGKIILSETRRLANVFPGDTSYVNVQTNCSEMPTELDVSVDVANANAKKMPKESTPSFTFEGLNASSDSMGTSFLGEVEASGDMSGFPENVQTQVLIILRDENRNIISGQSDYVDLSRQGAPSSFEVRWYDPPEYASWEPLLTFV